MKLIKKLFYLVRGIYKCCTFNFFYIFPIKDNKIVISNFAGNGYSDSPKYIAEELIKSKNKYDIVWLLKDINQELPKEIRKVKYGSVTGMYELATAKVWIDNIRNSHMVRKKKKQIFLQTWHGSRAVKYIEKDAMDKLNKQYIKQAKYDGKITNGILAGSKIDEEVFRRAFWLNDKAEILRFGIPRNDIIIKHGNDDIIKQKIRKKLDILYNTYVIMYAPTFRDDNSTDGYIYEYESIINKFEKKTGKKSIILVRMHPNVRGDRKIINYNDYIIDVTLYPDAQELSIISDCIITDYSTMMFDFTLLKKPVFLYAKDIKKFKKDRGLVDEYYKLPFPISYSMNELEHIIESFDIRKYNKCLEEYERKSPDYNKGNASKLTVEWIEERRKA